MLIANILKTHTYRIDFVFFFKLNAPIADFFKIFYRISFPSTLRRAQI